mmetsp:Transcript_8595/g.11035  ORF Transcript_8595/g.11035 Transcript_8595/m.11035 type:complete len:82 (+) Transcript_8595:1022-1267(+)
MHEEDFIYVSLGHVSILENRKGSNRNGKHITNNSFNWKVSGVQENDLHYFHLTPKEETYSNSTTMCLDRYSSNVSKLHTLF